MTDLADYTIRLLHKAGGAEAEIRTVQDAEGRPLWRVIIDGTERYANLDQETALDTAARMLREQGAKTNPRVTKIGRTSAIGTRYLLVGGDLAPGWTPRDGKVAWCEVTVYDRGFVGSFGGEVWPAAWPHLFHHAEPTAQCPCHTTVTDEGKRLLAEAPLHECESEHTPDGHGAYCRWCGETLE